MWTTFTAPSRDFELLESSVVIYGGCSNFEEPISKALQRIKDIQAVVTENPNTNVRVHLDVVTPQQKGSKQYYQDQKLKLRKLLKAITTLPSVVSFSLNMIKSHKTPRRGIVQQDKFVSTLLNHVIAMGRDFEVPTINLRVSTNIDDEYPWTFVTAGIRNVLHNDLMPFLAQVCIVMEFLPVPGIDLGRLDYDLRRSRRKIVGLLKLLHDSKPEVKVMYYIHGATGARHDFVEKLNVTKLPLKSKRRGVL